MGSDYKYNATLTAIHDGDTVTVEVDLGFYITARKIVRLAGINAPELSTPEGVTAKTALVGLVGTLPRHVTVQSYKTGIEKYGRWLADIWVGDTLINQWMIDNKQAVPFMT